MKQIKVTKEELKGISLHRSKFAIFYVLVLGASLAGSSLLWASASLLNQPLNLDPQQHGDPDKTHQPRSPQPSPNGSSGRGDTHAPAQSEPPRSADGHTLHEPSHPGANPRSPQTGGSTVKPGRPGSGPSRPPAHPAPRPPAHRYPHHRPVRPHYNWGNGSGWRLHRFFIGDMRPINRMHRNHFFIGDYFPHAFLDRIQPIPAGLMVYLPPVPPGYEIGYYDGYCLVYDPYSLEIVSVIDLYRY